MTTSNISSWMPAQALDWFPVLYSPVTDKYALVIGLVMVGLSLWFGRKPDANLPGDKRQK